MMDARRIILERLKERGWSMSRLSRELGRNHAYIQQYVSTHTPQDLEFRDKVKVAKLLSIPLPDLGIELDPASAPRGGLAEEAAPWTPPKGSFLAPAPGHEYFRAATSALDRHRLQINAGDIVVVDISTGVLERIQSGDAVLVQAYDKPDGMTATTVMRQFIAPGLLITNSSGENTIWRIDDASLPFEPVIKGRIVSVVRPASTN